MKTEVVVVMFLVLLGVLVDQTECQCCRSNFFTGGCGDGTRGTPCCGYRPCNFFCCNCKEGCRGKREVGADDSTDVPQDDQEEDAFQKFDADGDGKISVNEASKWLIAGGCGNPFVKVMALTSEFGKLDADSDGGLDRGEIGG